MEEFHPKKAQKMTFSRPKRPGRYRKHPAIRPGLMHEGCAGEGRSTRVLNSSMVLLVKYSLIEESKRVSGHGMAVSDPT